MKDQVSSSRLLVFEHFAQLQNLLSYMKPHLFFFFPLCQGSVFLLHLLFAFLKRFSYSLIKISVSIPLTRIFSLFSVVSSCEEGLES